MFALPIQILRGLLFSVLPTAWSTGQFPTIPPDISLATLPVLYYGANWNRSEENIETLAKMQIVVLMQEDGPCWRKCCPNPGPGQCGVLHNATALLGCEPECDQHGWQMSVCERIKLAARRLGRRDPHCMLYMNSVYDFPFDKTHALGNEIDLLDTHGNPHMESIDPGLYPAFFFDFGRQSAQDAWLSIIQRAVVEGPADGVYVDCYFDMNPFHCQLNQSLCTARRNGRMASINEMVTRDQVDAWIDGKNRTLWTASALVGPNGSFYAKQKPSVRPAHGGNMVWIQPGYHCAKGPDALIPALRTSSSFFNYVVVGGPNTYSNPMVEESLKSICSESDIAQFLLAMEPGNFILCNGWDEHFDRPLGQPLGPAKFDQQTQSWSRSFEHGTQASWAEGKGAVAWAPALEQAAALLV